MRQQFPPRLAVAAALLLSACGVSPLSTETGAAAGQPPAAPPTSADVAVLMMGNSHTSGHQLPGQLQAMLQARFPGRTVAVVQAPKWLFLDERLADPMSRALLRSRPWLAVVLQAQRYSSSGARHYSTAAAEQWIQEVRKVQALPVLFPEWPRRGVDEAARIYDLHVTIARKQAACVAPIGQAWELSLARHPALALHASDGNHSAMAGAHLAALMLYTTITGASPLGLPALPQLGSIDSAVQGQLRQVAADTAHSVAPRQHCPEDKL